MVSGGRALPTGQSGISWPAMTRLRADRPLVGATPRFAFMVEPLGKHHNRAAFTSGSEFLDRYLQHQAGQEARRHIAVTFVLVNPETQAIAGDYTLLATSISPNALPPEIAAGP